MSEDFRPGRRSRRRAIRRRVARTSLATFLAASGAVVAQSASGDQSGHGHAASGRTSAAVRSDRGSVAVSPSAVTTSAS